MRNSANNSFTHNSQTKLKRLIPYLLDQKTGIIHSIQERPRQAHMPDFFAFTGYPATKHMLGQAYNPPPAGGVGYDRDRALIKTVGESIERYGAGFIPEEALIFAGYNELGSSAIPPESFALFSEGQYAEQHFPFVPFADDAPRWWTHMTDLNHQTEYWVPASFVYQPYPDELGQQEPLINSPISTGLAAHSSFEAAAINGLLEVIERDCFTVTWQAGLSRTLIDLSSLSPFHQDLNKRFTQLGYQIYFVNITNETGIPAILAYMESRDPQRVPVCIATAAHLNPEAAMTKCFEELAQVEFTSQFLRQTTPPFHAEKDFSNVLSFEDHIRLWLSPDVKDQARFLITGSTSQPLSDLANLAADDPKIALDRLVQHIARTGYRALVKNITSPDLAELGLFVVRAMIPGYHPLTKGHTFRALGGKRLWTLPRQLGYSGINAQTGDNPLPHPFA